LNTIPTHHKEREWTFSDTRQLLMSCSCENVPSQLNATRQLLAMAFLWPHIHIRGDCALVNHLTAKTHNEDRIHNKVTTWRCRWTT